MDDLIALATPYALHAMTESERADIDRRLAAAPPAEAQAFADEVRAVREAMAVVSAATAVEPPHQLRHLILAEARPATVRELRPTPRRWPRIAMAAAAAVAIGLGALGVGIALRPAPTQSAAEQIFAAADVRTISGDIPGGGTATVVFSRAKNAGVLVMNNVTPPKAGTVYQMWLIRPGGPKSAGTMDAAAVAPSTTAVLSDLGDSKALAFTIEPPGGSSQPTSAPFAELPLTA
jgi:anti-sigma-K factor RskA